MPTLPPNSDAIQIPNLHDLYSRLLSYYGPQGWWPLIRLQPGKLNPTERGRYTWYHPEDYDTPEVSSDIFEIMVGAILTQNTSWENADKALGKLSNNSMLTSEQILHESEENLAELIRSSGYYNQKTLKLKNLARFITRNPIQKLKSHPIDELRTMLLSVKGIGPETADSILLYAFKKPIFVIDTYTKRLISRIGLLDEQQSYSEFQSYFHSQIPTDYRVYNEYHALIVQHCVRICKKTPLCSECWLSSSCMKKIPIKPKKKKKIKKKNKTEKP